METGIIPQQGARITIDELKNMSDADIIERDARCHRAYINARQLLKTSIHVDDWAKDVKVYWIQGPSGVGKSTRATQIIRDNGHIYGYTFNPIAFRGDFFHGVGSAKIALYDEFRDSHMPASTFISFIDYNKQLMNVKGGSYLNEYNLIIITSIQNLHEIYSNVTGEPRTQWLRRIEVIDLN